MTSLPVTRERRRPVSDYFKDVLALVVGTVLVMMVWFALGGGMHRLSPDREMDSRSAGSPPVSAIGAATAGLER